MNLRTNVLKEKQMHRLKVKGKLILPLINFLKEVLNLDIINDRKTSTTRCGTTIDAVFARFIDNLSTNLYVSHFSYHKPIVSIMEKNIHNEPIVPAMVEDMSIDESVV